jgi:hypothetical protein
VKGTRFLLAPFWDYGPQGIDTTDEYTIAVKTRVISTQFFQFFISFPPLCLKRMSNQMEKSIKEIILLMDFLYNEIIQNIR